MESSCQQMVIFFVWSAFVYSVIENQAHHPSVQVSLPLSSAQLISQALRHWLNAVEMVSES